MLKYIFFFIFTIFNTAYSQCNFVTGNYIEELSNPSHIELIEINTPKSSKYYKNAFEIMTSEAKNIAPDLRKEFVASITVNYEFGHCNYTGRVRQSGDWKDHITLINGQIIRSLDVKLNEGNIVNAVNFKLLIPETRNSLNEILASLILKRLDFISPETFEVKTSINGVNATMIFQEKARKELIERNKRREGPIFEGDESIIWNVMDKREQLKELSLSRLVNANWFKSNEVAREITIYSFELLQKSYIKSRYNYQKNRDQFKIFPNSLKNKKFVDFHATLIAMNAEHAFYVNNRKYFFNTLENSFEPIYYDGDPNFLKEGHSQKYYDLISETPSNKLFRRINDIDKDDKLFQDFIDRTIKQKNRDYFFQTSLQNFKKNISDLKKHIYNIPKASKKENDKQIKIPANWYKITQETLGMEQNILSEVKSNDNYYKGIFVDGDYKILTENDLADIFSKNKFGSKRTVFVPSKDGNETNDELYHLNIQDISITMSKELKIEVNQDKKIIKFIQVNSNDWVMLSGGKFIEWEIVFVGLPKINNQKLGIHQRYNKYGLTGCLSFYKSYLANTSIYVNDGGCEDSVNFINSEGENLNLIINDSFADAVDADFSKLSFSSLTIDNAGNDCLDVSGGVYKIEYALLNGCKDKALSIGEKSILDSEIIFINNSNIAIASKDFSKTEISLFEAMGVNLCAEVKQKKQEFGGAILLINDLNCDANIEIDSASKFKGNAT